MRNILSIFSLGFNTKSRKLGRLYPGKTPSFFRPLIWIQAACQLLNGPKLRSQRYMLTEWYQQAVRYIASSCKTRFLSYADTILMYMYMSFYDMQSDVPYQTDQGPLAVK